MHKWKQQLRTLRDGRLRPDREWTARNRAVLLAQIRNTVKTESSERQSFSLSLIFDRVRQGARLFLPERLLVAGRSLSIASLVGLMAVGGWIASVSASYGSLPGEALYSVKVAAEKTELLMATVVGDDRDKVETLLKHASNRVEEVQNSKTPGQATVAIHSLKKSIESANKTLESVETNEGSTDAEVAEVAKVVTEKTEKLLASLEAAGSDSSAESQTAETAKELGEAAHLIEVTGVRAVEVLIEQNLAGNADVTLAEVKATVEKKLEKVVTDISSLAASSTPLVVSSTAGDMVSSSTAVTAAEAKTLIDNNDLLGAIKKVQTLTEVKKDAGTAMLEAKLIIGNTASTTPATATTTPAITSTTTSGTSTVKGT